jgi:hypothetical protein
LAGSWEIREANKVVVAILHVDQTTIAWSFGLRNLQIPGREDLRQWPPFLPLAGMPFDHARNTSVYEMLRRGAEYLFSLDSDVIPPKDTIHRLIAHKLPIVSGMYCRRSPPHSIPVMIRDGQWVTKFTPGSLVEVDLVGAGCLLVHRSVFENLPPQRPEAGKHWFDWRVDLQGHPNNVPELPPLSEDFTFTVHAKNKLGVRTFVDTGVVCKHIGSAEAGYGTFLPLNTEPRT